MKWPMTTRRQRLHGYDNNSVASKSSAQTGGATQFYDARCDDGSSIASNLSMSQRIHRSIQGAGRAFLCTFGGAGGDGGANSRDGLPDHQSGVPQSPSRSDSPTSPPLSNNDSTASQSNSHSSDEGGDDSVEGSGGGGGFILTLHGSGTLHNNRSYDDDEEAADPRTKMLYLQEKLRQVENQLLYESTHVVDENGNKLLECLPEDSSVDDASLSTISTGYKTTRSWSGSRCGSGHSLVGVRYHECGVCSEPLLTNRFVGACLPCGHCFHEDCFYGSWASTLLQDNDQDIPDLGHGWFPAPCAECGAVVDNFGRLSVNVDEAMGPTHDFGTSDYAFKKLLAKAKLATLIRRCVSVPSSPKLVCEVLRLTMDRIRRVTDIDTGEVGAPVKAEFMAVGGHVATMHAVTRYRDSPDVCGWSNALLAELSVRHANVLYLTTPDLVGFVSASMLKHPLHVALQSNGCCTLAELLKSSFGLTALDEIDQANGFTAVRDALVRFTNTSLRQNAVSFLTLAAELNPVLACQHVCSDQLVLDVLVCILHDTGRRSNVKLYPVDMVLLRLVCRLLFLASGRPEFRTVLARAGADRAFYGIYQRKDLSGVDEYSHKLSGAVLQRLGRPVKILTAKNTLMSI
jgi:hypothetical protein